VAGGQPVGIFTAARRGIERTVQPVLSHPETEAAVGEDAGGALQRPPGGLLGLLVAAVLLVQHCLRLTLVRAYYHCSRCETGFCPRDRALGLQGDSLSPGVLRRRSGERWPRTSVASWRLPWPAKWWHRRCTWGWMVRVYRCAKTELVDRSGKQPDGTAKTLEVKLVTVWSAEGRDPEGIPVRDKGSISYSAAIESAATRDTDTHPAEFVQRVVREATRRGFDQAPCQVVLGDGALWIWNLADEHFPDAIQIVDLYHAKGHLSDVAKAIYSAGNDLGEQWARPRRDELDEGMIDDVLAALNVHARATEKARQCVDYVIRNRDRMRYPEFRAQGLCVSTGCSRGRLQDCDRGQMQAGGDALDRRRSRRDHRPALLRPQRPLRGLLGAAVSRGRDRRVISSHRSDVRPPADPGLSSHGESARPNGSNGACRRLPQGCGP